MLSSVISVTVKTTDEHLVGRRSPAGALLWFFGKRSDTQKTTRGLQKDTYYSRYAEVYRRQGGDTRFIDRLGREKYHNLHPLLPERASGRGEHV